MSRMNCVALILRTQPYGESDLIVDLFTEQQGRTRVIARGALRSKRRYMGVLEPGALVKVDYPIKSGLPTLGPCDVVSSHRKLRQDLSALRQLYYILELLLLVTPEGEADEALFRSAVELLVTLESTAGLPAALLYAWELNLLSHLGYHLRIDRCPYTQAPPDGLSYQDGGAISSKSQRRHWPVPTETLRTLYRLQRCGDDLGGLIDSISPEENQILRPAFAGIWSEIIGHPLKSEQVFQKVNFNEGVSLVTSSNSSSNSSSNHLSTSLQYCICFVFLLVMSACQGLERIPSQATLEVQPTKQPTKHQSNQKYQETTPYLKQNHSAKHPKGLPKDLNSLIRATRSKDQSVVIELNQKSHSLGVNPIYCEFTSSILSSVFLSDLMAGPINIKNAQPKLWIESQVGNQLQPHLVDQESLQRYLVKVKKDTQAPVQLFTPYQSASNQQGAWIIYFPKKGKPQSLILAKNSPWIHDRAWKIATCEQSDTLSSLTHIPLDLYRSPISSLQLILVSAEVHAQPNQ